MEELSWTSLYLYTQKASDQFVDRVNQAAETNPQLTYKELNEFDLIHPGKHMSIEKLIRDYQIPPGAHGLEIGVGYGGTSRYLVCEKGIKLYGIDFLENLVDASNHANKVLNIGPNIEHVQGDILTHPLQQDFFDFAFTIGVFMHIEDPRSVENTIQAIKPGGLLFVEDYLLVKEPHEYTENDRVLLKERHMYGVRTDRAFRDLLVQNGMEILEFAPWKHWSEECWERAERIIVGQKEGTLSLTDDHFYQYVQISPQVACDMDHYTPEELRTKFPNMCNEFNGEEIVFQRPKLSNIFRVVARKTANN